MNSSVLPEVRKHGRRTRSSTSNVNKYIIKKCKTSTYQKSFLIRTSRIWNCLVDELDLSSSTLASFKSVIFKYYKSALAVSYDCEDPRSFKSICLKCNSARPLPRPITCCKYTSCSFSCIAVFFNISCFYFFISILIQCSFCFFACLFVFLAKLIMKK